MPLTGDWTQLLFEIYREGRMSPGWPIIWDCHDQEDRDYFWMLEDEMDAGRLTVVPWPKPVAVSA